MPPPARNLFSNRRSEGEIVPNLILAMELPFAHSVQYFGKDRHLAPARAWAHLRSNAGALESFTAETTAEAFVIRPRSVAGASMRKPTKDPTGHAERRSKQSFAVGSLHRLSALGIKNMPRPTQRVCTVVGFGNTRSLVRVKLAGSKAAQTRTSYLKVIMSADVDHR
jgi:hypothetical protein